MHIKHKFSFLLKIVTLIVLIFFLNSCKHKRLDVNVSDVAINWESHHFEKIMFEDEPYIVPSKIYELYPDYSTFIDVYTEMILQIGGIDYEFFESNLISFLSDTVIIQVADTVLNTFDDMTEIEDDLKEGFKHYQYYFPEKMIPDVYTYISGFNESIVVSETFIGVSLDKYLGADCPFYQYLGIPKFKIENMYPEKIVPDVFYAWALTEYPYQDSIDNLLSHMIYQGKLMYFTEAMNPDCPDSVLIGYSSIKLDWCKTNEELMWSYLVDKKLIYTLERLDIRKFIGDAPFTNVFTDISPGRTGVWIGWQIVRSFMDNHRDVSLEQLMKMNDAQFLLSQSKYYPN